MRRTVVLLVVLAGALVAVAASVAALGTASPRLETEAFFDDDAGGGADADDPAIWVSRRNRADSLVIGTLKDAGLAVFDLEARTLQRIAPREDGRFNNVDILRGIDLGSGARDLAVVTDRGLDRIRVFAIDPAGAAAALPLTEVTDPAAPRVYPDDELDEQNTAYGIAAWKGRDGAYVFASRRNRTQIAMLRLVQTAGGVTYEEVDRLALPSSFPLPDGSEWTPCEEPGELPQVEGMVVHTGRGATLLAGQEDVGIWRIDVSRRGFGRPVLEERVREFGQPWELVPDEEDPTDFECEVDEGAPSFGDGHLSTDVEGLTVIGGLGSTGLLFASSQGDDTFALYALPSIRFLGNFELVDGAVDGVQESDGAAVVATPLTRDFPFGLLVTHDGEDTPETPDDEGEPRPATNFKYTPLQDVARGLLPGLTTGADD